MFVRALGAALVVGLGLASVGVGAATAETSTTRVAVVVPIVVPATSDELLDATTLARYTGAQGILTRQLDAVTGRTVSIGIDPRIIASIRLLGDTAPASATAWLERLRSLPNESFALAYADADLTLQTQAGSGVLVPESFDFAIDPARFASPTNSPSPTAAPVDTAPPLPTSETVLGWPYSLDGIAWPRDDSLVASDLPELTAAGFTTTIVSSANATRESAAGPSSTTDGGALLVSDSAASAVLRTAAAAPLAADWSAASAQLSAALAADGGTVLLTLDRSTSYDRLGETLDALAADPAVQLVGLSAALATPASSADIVDMPQDADRLSRVGQMMLGETAERAFATVAVDPTAITSERRLELLALLSTEWDDDPAAWPDAADEFTTRSVELRNAVHLVTGSNFLLVADNDQYLPITVNNGLDQPVVVYVSVRSQSGLLAIDDPRVELPIGAGAQGKVNVPVHSLSNGVVEVVVSLESGAGVAIGAPVRSSVNVQAGWETPIVVAIAVIVVLVFGIGIVRTILRRRRTGRADD